MSHTFECEACRTTFEAEGEVRESVHPLYGACRKRVAPCPACGAEARDYRPPSLTRSAPSPACPFGDGGGSAPCGGSCPHNH